MDNSYKSQLLSVASKRSNTLLAETWSIDMNAPLSFVLAYDNSALCSLRDNINIPCVFCQWHMFLKEIFLKIGATCNSLAELTPAKTSSIIN